MAKVPNGIEIMPKISMAWVGCTNVTDDRRQTDRWQTDGRTTNYSEREREFTFAKNDLKTYLRTNLKTISVNLGSELEIYSYYKIGLNIRWWDSTARASRLTILKASMRQVCRQTGSAAAEWNCTCQDCRWWPDSVAQKHTLTCRTTDRQTTNNIKTS